MTMSKKRNLYKRYWKRILDLIFSALVLLLFCWLYLLLALLVRAHLGRPVLFSQDRPGKDGKTFKLYKFRSMTDERDEDGKLLPDKKRLTKFGRLLRSTSLDELPEMYNILRGDMSLIGPRPLLVKYLPHYNAFEMRRHEVRPGLTGLAQVSGRAALSWEKKFEKDVEYVDHVTFANDVKIFLLTIRQILSRKDTEFKSGNQMIMDYFNEREKKLEDEGK